MEAVKLFNQELSSLYEIKPPISKAKMTAITKGAIRAIKYYKHVVQSVEKFIQKCRPEYKIPGLYVIDSIVRQSRHQFGAAKDVFAPRFAKNVTVTFYHLYKCPEEEKSRVIRVLNLWQKNEVFTADIIGPLFDLANPNSETYRSMDDQIKRGETKQNTTAKAGSIQVVSQNPGIQSQNSETELDAADQQTISTIQQFLKMGGSSGSKKLFDFDYSDDEDGGQDQITEPTPQMLEALVAILNNERLLNKLKAMGEITPTHIAQLQQLLPQFQNPWQQIQTNNPEAQINPSSWHGAFQASMQQPVLQQSDPHGQVDNRHHEDEDIQVLDDRRSNDRRGRSRSPRNDRKRSSRSHRSRSRSRDRSSRSRRRSRSRDREEREKRREREKKGLPALKKGFLSVCSTTLWVGHLSKLVADEDLSDLFGEYGVVESINLIPPRGCAFVHMNRRMDAYKALKELHKYKLHGKPITIAWAPGKGMKDKQWKDYWDVSLGVSYIPLDKLDPQVDLVALEDGGHFDEDTMPEWMKNSRATMQTMPAHQQPAQPQFMASAASEAALGMPLQAGVDLGLLPGGPPPGVPPFGLPPGMPPQGILPPGAILPPNILPPRFAAPPGFPPPAFDTSQPPPGMRMAFPPPQVPNVTVPNVEGQGDVEMEIEEQEEMRPQRSAGGQRGSRWNKDDNDRGGPPGSDGPDGGPPRSLLDMPPMDNPGWNNGNDGPPNQDPNRDLFNDGPGGMRRPPFGPRGGPFEGGPRFGGPPEGFEPFNRPPGGPGFRPDGPFNDNFNNFGGPPRGGRGGWRGGRGGRGGFDGPPPRGPMPWRDDGPVMGGGPPFGSGGGSNDREWDREQPPWNDRGRGGRGRGDRGGRGFDRRSDRGGFGGFNDRNNDRGDHGGFGSGDRGGFGSGDRGGFGNNGGFGDRDRDRDNRDNRDRRDRSRERDRSRDRDSRPAKRERRSRWGSQAESGEPESAGHSQEVQDLINAQEQQFEMQQQKPENDQAVPVDNAPSVPDNAPGSEAPQDVSVIPESNEAPVQDNQFQENIPANEPVHQEPEPMAEPMPEYNEPEQQPEYHEPEQEPEQPEYHEPVQQPEYHEPAHEPEQPEYEAPPVQEPLQPEYHEPVHEPVQPEYEAPPVQDPVPQHEAENSHSAAFEKPLEEANHRQEHLPEQAEIVPEQEPEFLAAKPAIVDLPATFANNGSYVDENNALENTEEPQPITITAESSSSEVNIETEASINE